MESVTDIAEADVVVIDKERQSITIDTFGAATPPQMQPVGLALTTYQGNNTFRGKSQAGTPLSFSLDNNYRVFKLQHGNANYTLQYQILPLILTRYRQLGCKQEFWVD